MIKISDQLVEEVIRPYREDLRVLKSAEFEYPLAKGVFVVGPTYYYTPPFEHLTDIEAQLCLNQLSYTAVAEMMRLNMVPDLRGLKFSELQNENMLIVESRKRFKRPIRRNVEISGDLRFVDQRRLKNVLFSYAEFQFEDRSYVGSLELAIIIPEAKK